MKKSFFETVCTFLILFFFCSCSQPTTAKLWTDRAEFAFYVQYFNTSQNKYKIEVRYLDNLAIEFSNTNENPDIVVGSWLKSSELLPRWKTLDFIFNNNTALKQSFYPSLLNLGKIKNKQTLLPVSFDLQIIVFSENTSSSISNSFIIELDELRNLATNYNIRKSGIYTQMGFSPVWNHEFLYKTASLFGASFREGNPLSWNNDALNDATTFIKNWIYASEPSIQSEDEFVYKYFSIPPIKLVTSGRILFAAMKSSEYFTTPAEQRALLDFRMLTKDEIIPVSEGSCLYALTKRGKAKKAQIAFTQWFFKDETQKLLIEESKNKHLSDTVFGLSKGFSSLRTVTENVFPKFYPSLIGRLPLSDFLTPSDVLSQNWPELKEKIIIPYLLDECRNPQGTDVSLEKYITDWLKKGF